jgi:hypothetical protein
MKKGSTLFLKGVLVIMAVAALAICIFALPAIWKGGSEEFPTASRALLLIVIGLYATAVPLVLWQSFKLLRYIDKDQAFSQQSINALKVIKLSASVIAVLYVGGVPLLAPIAQADDAPGLMLIGLVIACAPIAVAVFAAILQKLLQSAMEIKSENELTV